MAFINNAVHAVFICGCTSMLFTCFFWYAHRTVDITPVKSTTCNPEVYLVVVVCSKWDEDDRRNSIRSSWGQWMNKRVKLVFLLGRQNSLSPDKFAVVRTESYIHDDIVYEPSFIDTYRNLTRKTIAALTWTCKFCGFAKWFFKADSDTFLNIPSLLDLLKSHQEDQSLIIGNVQINATVHRNNQSKWFVSHKEHVSDIYPPYATGPGYIISMVAVRQLEQYGSQQLISGHEPFVWEDVCVTGLWRKALHIRLNHSSLIHYEDWTHDEDTCVLMKQVLLHRVNNNNMKELWTRWQTRTTKNCNLRFL